jgi:diguanylate cyclase (GGDEF)-like protein
MKAVRHHPLLFLGALLAALGIALHLAGTWERRTAVRAATRTEVANRLVTAMLDQETGLRGYLLTAREDFLQPWTTGTVAYQRALGEAARSFKGDPTSTQLLNRENATARRWQTEANESIDATRRLGLGHESLATYRERKLLFDSFRDGATTLSQQLDRRRNDELGKAGTIATLTILALVALLGGGAWVLLSASSRRQRRHDAGEIDFRVGQREFADVVTVVREEAEAHTILKRHIERSIADARATVLSRNNSENRLEATTELPADASLATALQDAEPRSCLAVRLARTHNGGHGDDAQLSCELCGKAAQDVMCEPLLVGGEVIGSLLVEHVEPLDEMSRRRIAESVSQAAPVIANLRNLARAESRAATDALTGLPNRRSVNESLKRMSAQAARSGLPLAALAIDLDHFKQVNDRWGHDRGDQALAAVGALLNSLVRETDVAGRMGGEEFVVLAPHTGREGAVVLADNLCQAIGRMQVPGVPDAFSASIGVAVMPDDAAAPEGLMRLADRALYAAKAAGRNRVMVSEAPL